MLLKIQQLVPRSEISLINWYFPCELYIMIELDIENTGRSIESWTPLSAARSYPKTMWHKSSIAKIIYCLHAPYVYY